MTNPIDQPTQATPATPATPPAPTARITRRSILTGRTRTLEIPQYTPEEFERRLYAYTHGNVDIFDAFPLISDRAKLFIEKGITVEEWEEEMTNKL